MHNQFPELSIPPLFLSGIKDRLSTFDPKDKIKTDFLKMAPSLSLLFLESSPVSTERRKNDPTSSFPTFYGRAIILRGLTAYRLRRSWNHTSFCCP